MGRTLYCHPLNLKGPSEHSLHSLIALGDGDNAPGDEGVQAVLNPVRVPVIGEAVRHLVKKRLMLLDSAQQQQAGIGSDRTAVESGHHTAGPVAFKLQRFESTLYRHRFSF